MPSTTQVHNPAIAQDASPRACTQAGHDLWNRLLDYEHTYMALRNFAAATRRGYASDIRLFLRYLSDQLGITGVDEVERTHLHQYFAELDRHSRAGATRARWAIERSQDPDAGMTY